MLFVQRKITRKDAGKAFYFIGKEDRHFHTMILSVGKSNRYFSWITFLTPSGKIKKRKVPNDGLYLCVLYEDNQQ